MYTKNSTEIAEKDGQSERIFYNNSMYLLNNDSMYLIVGLGNPGKEYSGTRHNAGFSCMDILAARHSIRLSRKSCQAQVGKGIIGGEKVILAKPQTYMNLSGRSVGALLYYHKISLNHLIVLYDDCDLDVGRLRIRKSGSAGGHNGMKSIIEMTGTQEFARIRMGIGQRPAFMDMPDYVLGHFSREEQAIMAAAYEKAADAAADILINGIDHAMNFYN